MRKLSDIKNEEAIELWADLLDPITEIMTDSEFQKMAKQKKTVMEQVKYILKKHKGAAVEILEALDPSEPLDAMNIVTRVLAIFSEIGQRKEMGSFFESAERAKPESESFGSVTESTEEPEQ